MANAKTKVRNVQYNLESWKSICFYYSTIHFGLFL